MEQIAVAIMLYETTKLSTTIFLQSYLSNFFLVKLADSNWLAYNHLVTEVDLFQSVW